MPGVHDEATFESAIEHHLLDNGYFPGDVADYDPSLAVDSMQLFAFIEATQAEQWSKLVQLHGQSEARSKFLNRLQRELDRRGSLDVLRRGVTDLGVKFRLAYFKPAASFGPDLVQLYEANRLSVARQVPLLGAGGHAKTVDLALFVNGIPVVTAELKNPTTGQTYRNAIKQYRTNRNPKDPLFAYPTRALVHFAVDPDEVHMTTKLALSRTRFLPLNKGRGGGKGNPDNPNGYKTAYLWEEVLQRDSLLDLIQRFITIEYAPGAKKTPTNGTVIFPRYHQLGVVRQLEADAKESGPGNNYLVMHSTGSGKSLSIAWAAHRLFSLHNDQDERVFNTVVVVTDRRVLDDQLQDTIYSIEHKDGVVEGIKTGGAKSDKLAAALEIGVPIIITTLQTFPFVLDRIGQLPERNYAVIVDEAHSSQTGTTARKLREVLTASNLEEAAKEDEDPGEWDVEDEILKTLEAVGKQPNLSFFAFTATPKAKTLEMFGVDGPDGKPRPFHTYSMKQAIEEGFIMDTLSNYTTYDRFFKLAKDIEEDPEFESRAARKAIANFIELHPHNISQKVQVIVEHFRQSVRNKINGQAKAMLVTRSRLHAVRYYHAVRKYVKEHASEPGYDLGVLVAFSGTVKDPDSGFEYTERVLNGFGEGELPEQYDGTDYQLLIVAEKYQTGFNQPKLHAMYVDKKLRGVHAVQTLGRLNRIHPAKEDPFVLDFVNTPDDILDAFAPYYRGAVLSSRTDPNLLYDLKVTLDDSHVYWTSEVDKFARIFWKPAGLREPADQGKLNAVVDLGVGRFQELEEEEKEDFRTVLAQFLRLYSFLAHVVTFKDPELEKLHEYGRWLIRKLPRSDTGRSFDLDDEVALAAYRLDGKPPVDIDLDDEELRELDPVEGIGGVSDETYIRLSELIEAINERFGLNLTEADALFFEQVGQDMLTDDTLAAQAKAATKDNFKIAFEDAFIGAVLGRKDRNDDILALILDKPDLAQALKNQMLDWIYHGLQERKSIPELLAAGESDTVEFKSSARWNLHAGKETPEIKDAITKTVAAFLNTDGGTLLIGVNDDAEVVGLENDVKLVKGKDLDGFENWLIGSHLQSVLGKPAAAHMKVSWGHLDSGHVCRLDVHPSPGPVYASIHKVDGNFYKRTGNSTHELNTPEAVQYIGEQW